MDAERFLPARSHEPAQAAAPLASAPLALRRTALVPFYNGRTPELLGFPFFYWYQLAWVPITALLTWLVYRGVRDDGA